MSEPGGNQYEDALSASEMRRLRFRNIPIRVVLPNLVTLLALCMGLTSIRYAIEGRFETAITAVMAAAVLDGLDGRCQNCPREGVEAEQHLLEGELHIR